MPINIICFCGGLIVLIGVSHAKLYFIGCQNLPERLLLAELRSPGSSYERLLWRKYLVMEGKILKSRI